MYLLLLKKLIKNKFWICGFSVQIIFLEIFQLPTLQFIMIRGIQIICKNGKVKLNLILVSPETSM